MADDPKSKAPVDGVQSNISPAPSEVAGEKPDAAKKSAGRIEAEPLSDGTVPTVLTPGQSHHSVPKGKATIAGIYRKADIMTTLFTFAGAVVAAVIILGAYVYLTRSKAKPSAPPGKTTTLSSSDLSKLGSFFNGNSAGSNGQVLTVSSPSLFKTRVAVDSDLKVTGALEVGGTSTLSNLTVDQITNLGVTNVRGQLTVDGPVNLQSPATLSGGGTVKGNLAVSGNGSFGGSVSAGVLNVTTLSVTGTLNINGHLAVGGRTPSVSAVSGVTSSASIEGNDTAGTISVTVLAPAGQSSGASLATVNFSSGFSAIPVVMITPVGRAAAVAQPYVSSSATSFTINAAVLPSLGTNTTYSFNYWVVQY